MEVVVSRLSRAVDRLVLNGVTSFFTFGEKGFDTLAATVVLAKREEMSCIKLVLVRRYSEHLRPNGQTISPLAEKMLGDMDKVIYTSVRRDQFIIQNTSTCIGYVPNKLSLLLHRKVLKKCFFINMAFLV